MSRCDHAVVDQGAGCVGARGEGAEGALVQALWRAVCEPQVGVRISEDESGWGFPSAELEDGEGECPIPAAWREKVKAVVGVDARRKN